MSPPLPTVPRIVLPLTLALLLASCVLVAVALLTAAPSARADVFGPSQIVSVGRLEGFEVEQQAKEAKDTAISGNGQYVVFDGAFGGKTGVFRRDLATGEVQVVAEGKAELPSISETGQYVSFTTNERLDEENDRNSSPDVYVRNMDIPDEGHCRAEWEQNGEQCPFTIASAVDGSSQGLEYHYELEEGEFSARSLGFEESHYGSLAAGRSALDASGNEVVFVTIASSDLNGPEQAYAPKLQVVVRYLETKRTELVSTVYREGQETSEPVPVEKEAFRGAAFPGGDSPPEFPTKGNYAGASLSADGNVVAWMANAVGKQAPTLAHENLEGEYDEALWREIGESGDGPTRRVTGGSDPLSPACEASGEAILPATESLADPCQGPFNTFGGRSGAGSAGLFVGGAAVNFIPRLSADGEKVAFIATAHYIPSGEESNATENAIDLYVADMAPGLTRVQALRRLTAVSGADGARGGTIGDFTISPDGTQVAFASSRTVFNLGTLSLVSPPEAEALAQQLYEGDLSNGTLTHVTVGYEGQRTEASGENNRPTSSPDFTSDDSLLAFSSPLDNLVYGDGNNADDAFLLEKVSFHNEPAIEAFSPPPPNPTPEPAWRLSVTGSAGRAGGATLYVEVPGAGSLRAKAQGTIKISSAGAHAKRAVSGRGHASAAKVRVQSRQIESASRASSSEGLVRLTLTPSKGYWKYLEAPHGLLAKVTVSFAAPGHSTISQTIELTLHRAKAHAASTRRGRRRR